jgi:hypothetical protein
MANFDQVKVIHADAVTFMEAYDCVAIAYNPVHPIVQMVSVQLIGMSPS